MISILFFIVSLFFILGTFAGVNKFFFLSLVLSFLFIKLSIRAKTHYSNVLIKLEIIILVVLSFFAGYFYFLLRIPQIDIGFAKSLSNQKIISSEIISEPKIYESYQKFIAKSSDIKINVFAPISYQIFYGDIVELTGDFELLTDKKQNLRGIFLKGFAKKIRKTGEHKTILKAIFEFKKIIESKLALQIPSAPLEIISGLLYGKDIVSSELKNNFKNAGLSHLTAMSGYNLTIISSSVFNVLKYFSVSKIFINFISIPFLTIFVIFAGAQGSIVRAFIMSIVLILIKNSGRIPLSRNILLGAGFLINLINPINLSFDLGFQLSFLATIGIIYLAPRIEQKMRINIQQNTANTTQDVVQFGVARFIKKTISEIIGAQIIVLPLIWHYFGEFNVLSIFSNLIILPLIPFFMFIGFLTLVFVFIPILPVILSYPFNLFSRLIEILSKIPIIYINPPSLFIIFIYIYIFYAIYQFNKKTSPDFHLKYLQK